MVFLSFFRTNFLKKKSNTLQLPSSRMEGGYKVLFCEVRRGGGREFKGYLSPIFPIWRPVGRAGVGGGGRLIGL